MYNPALVDTGQLIHALSTGSYSLVGFSANAANVDRSLDVATNLPEGTHVTIGGYSATLDTQGLLDHPRVDSVVRGEGEAAIVELAKALQSGGDSDSIPSVATKQCVTPPRRRDGLAGLPRPLRQEMFALAGRFPRDFRIALVSSSRGCAKSCSFCHVKAFYSSSPGPPVRFRDPNDVVDEIEELAKGSYSANYIYFVDDDFIGGNFARAEAIGRELCRRNLKLRFEIECRADHIDRDLFRLLKEAGLASVFIGIESFSQDVLNRFCKRMSVESNIAALETLADLDISYTIGMILFDRSTTIEDLRANVRFLDRFGFHNVNDPCRFLRNFPSLGEVRIEEPEDPAVWQIARHAFGLSESLSRRACLAGKSRRVDSTREALQEVRVRVGKELATAVR